MNILGVCGSPRKGNTETILETALNTCRKLGIESELVLLREVNFTGCCGFDDCFYENYCIKKDELGLLLEKMLKADALVFATPNYFNNVSGLMKNFMDRTNPFARPPKFKAKKVALIVVGGQKLNSLEACEGSLKDFCRIHKMQVIETMKITADKKSDCLNNPDCVRATHAFGNSLGRQLLENDLLAKESFY